MTEFADLVRASSYNWGGEHLIICQWTRIELDIWIHVLVLQYAEVSALRGGSPAGSSDGDWKNSSSSEEVAIRDTMLQEQRQAIRNLADYAAKVLMKSWNSWESKQLKMMFTGWLICCWSTGGLWHSARHWKVFFLDIGPPARWRPPCL